MYMSKWTVYKKSHIAWRKRHKAEGLCLWCLKPIWRPGAALCWDHHIHQRERSRKTRGAINRHLSSPSYAEQRRRNLEQHYATA